MNHDKVELTLFIETLAAVARMSMVLIVRFSAMGLAVVMRVKLSTEPVEIAADVAVVMFPDSSSIE